MKRFLKFIIALALLPFAMAAIYSYGLFFWDFAVRSFRIYWSFWAGIVLYPIIYYLGLKPMGVYVLEHELTHAILAVLTGGKVKKIYVKKNSGSVVVNKTNTVITLGPYILPLYAALFLVAWKIITRLLPAAMEYATVFYFAVGFALSFHFFMTSVSIMQGQSDLKVEGVLFSIILIFVLYVFISAIFLKLLFGDKPLFVGLNTFISDLKNNTVIFYEKIYHFLKAVIWPLISEKK